MRWHNLLPNDITGIAISMPIMTSLRLWQERRRNTPFTNSSSRHLDRWVKKENKWNRTWWDHLFGSQTIRWPLSNWPGANHLDQDDYICVDHFPHWCHNTDVDPPEWCWFTIMMSIRHDICQQIYATAVFGPKHLRKKNINRDKIKSTTKQRKCPKMAILRHLGVEMDN